MAKIDLSRTDTYPLDDVHESAVEECLKVIRTIRSVVLSPGTFNAETAVLLSHTHKYIFEMCVKHNLMEDEANAQDNPAKP